MFAIAYVCDIRIAPNGADDSFAVPLLFMYDISERRRTRLIYFC